MIVFKKNRDEMRQKSFLPFIKHTYTHIHTLAFVPAQHLVLEHTKYGDKPEQTPVLDVIVINTCVQVWKTSINRG